MREGKPRGFCSAIITENPVDSGFYFAVKNLQSTGIDLDIEVNGAVILMASDDSGKPLVEFEPGRSDLPQPLIEVLLGPCRRGIVPQSPKGAFAQRRPIYLEEVTELFPLRFGEN